MEEKEDNKPLFLWKNYFKVLGMLELFNIISLIILGLYTPDSTDIGAALGEAFKVMAITIFTCLIIFLYTMIEFIKYKKAANNKYLNIIVSFIFSILLGFISYLINIMIYLEMFG